MLIVLLVGWLVIYVCIFGWMDVDLFIYSHISHEFIGTGSRQWLRLLAVASHKACFSVGQAGP